VLIHQRTASRETKIECTYDKASTRPDSTPYLFR